MLRSLSKLLMYCSWLWNINHIPFRLYYALTLGLGPTNPYMSATRKEPFPTTIFKASITLNIHGRTNVKCCVFRLNICYYNRDLH